VFREPKLPKTHNKLTIGVIAVVNRDITPIDAPIHTLVLIKPAIATPAPTREENFVPVATKQNYAHGRVNHVAVEEAQEAHDVVIGMFLINECYAVVLFDSGASHSFISAAYIGMHNLPLALLRCQMIVSSPGGDMPARQLCQKVNLKIRGVDFVTNLIVLESKGIDVILEMD
jgi:hypothetical protein